jgi:hypothetical protein
MAFGDQISQGKNKKAKGGGVRNQPTKEVYYMLIGDTEWMHLATVSAGNKDIAHAVSLMFGDDLTGTLIEDVEATEEED